MPYVLYPEYLAHAGKAGMKWGYNHGKRNGKRTAEEIKEEANEAASNFAKTTIDGIMNRTLENHTIYQERGSRTIVPMSIKTQHYYMDLGKKYVTRYSNHRVVETRDEFRDKVDPRGKTHWREKRDG